MAATSNPNTTAIASIIHPTALAGCRPAINAPTEAHTTMTAAGNRRLGAGGRPGTTAATVRVPMAMTLMAAHSDQAPKAAIRVGILGMAASEVTSPSWAPVIPLARGYGPGLGRTSREVQVGVRKRQRFRVAPQTARRSHVAISISVIPWPANTSHILNS